MSSALKCDRCGKLYEHYKGIRVVDKGAYYCSMSLYTGDGWQIRDYGLCPDCIQSLVTFIMEGKTDGNS